MSRRRSRLSSVVRARSISWSDVRTVGREVGASVSAGSGAPDPADTLAPTSRPTVRTSDQEMERALTTLLSRERRRDIYAGLISAASVKTTPRGAWLLLRVGEHPGWGRHELAEHLYMTDAD